MKKQIGFTMIELIVVIVILGILAATALPRFIDFSSNASTAAVQGVAGGISSASAVNYAGAVLGRPVTPTVASGSMRGAVADVCTSANLGALLSTGWPTGGGVYTVAGAVASPASCVSGGPLSCTITFTPTGGTAVTADSAITCY